MSVYIADEASSRHRPRVTRLPRVASWITGIVGEWSPRPDHREIARKAYFDLVTGQSAAHAEWVRWSS